MWNVHFKTEYASLEKENIYADNKTRGKSLYGLKNYASITIHIYIKLNLQKEMQIDVTVFRRRQPSIHWQTAQLMRLRGRDNNQGCIIAFCQRVAYFNTCQWGCSNRVTSLAQSYSSGKTSVANWTSFEYLSARVTCVILVRQILIVSYKPLRGGRYRSLRS